MLRLCVLILGALSWSGLCAAAIARSDWAPRSVDGHAAQAGAETRVVPHARLPQTGGPVTPSLGPPFPVLGAAELTSGRSTVRARGTDTVDPELVGLAPGAMGGGLPADGSRTSARLHRRCTAGDRSLARTGGRAPPGTRSTGLESRAHRAGAPWTPAID